MPDERKETVRMTITLKREVPERLRFIERKERYILQEKVADMSESATVSVRWRDVPLVKL
jgi:hypothetical protein